MLIRASVREGAPRRPALLAVTSRHRYLQAPLIIEDEPVILPFARPFELDYGIVSLSTSF